MFTFARICGAVTADALNKLAESKNLSVPHIDVSSLLLETPPDPKMGDVGIPLFGFAKTFKQAPAQMAKGDSPRQGCRLLNPGKDAGNASIMRCLKLSHYR